MVFARSLTNTPNVRIFSTDYRYFTNFIKSKLTHKHFVVSNPSKLPDQFSKEIIKIVEENKIDFLIPINSSEIRLLLKVKDKLNNSLNYMGSYSTFSNLDNKEYLSSLVKEINIPSPKSYDINDTDIKFPVVFKPVESSSSKGVEYFYNKNDLTNHITNSKFQEYIIQQYIEGEGVGFSVLAKNGKIIASCGHKRVAEYPVSGGSSSIRKYFEHQDMNNIAKKILEHTKWSGFAMFEFKHTPDNEIYLIEINPRVWGSIYQSIASGVDFPKILIEQNEDTKVTLNKKIVTYISPLCWLSIMGYIFKQFNFKVPINFMLNFLNAKPDLSFTRDPFGYASLLLRKIT